MTIPARRIDAGRLIRPSKFGHVVLRVRDLDASIAWYGTVLGMEVVHRTPTLAFLTYDDEHHRLALLETPVALAAPPGAPGLDHVAYSLDSLHDLLATWRRLDAVGIRPYLPINHGPTTSLYYHDPDGHGVELQVDNFATSEALFAYMRGEAFAANPLGTPFDPEVLAARFERGDPLEQLVERGSA